MEGDYVVPKDRYKMVLWMMILHGVGLLLPWNMFINAKSYFIDYKLHVNYTGDSTPYGQYFMSYLGFAARVPNLIFSWINIFMNWKITYRTRIFWCIMIQIIVFSSNLFLSHWNSNKWPRLFLIITIFGFLVVYFTNLKWFEELVMPREKEAPPVEESEPEPKDRFKLIYVIMLIHGMGILIPWNMFTNAKAYFIDYKLHKNYTGDPTPYGQYFMSILGFAAMIPNLILSWVNVFIQWKADVRKRIIWVILIQIAIFFLNFILVLVDSSGWPVVFLVITMIGAVIMNCTTGLYTSSLYSFAGKLPRTYIGAIVLGNNVSGVLVSLISMFCDAVTHHQKTSAILFFLIAIIFLFVSFTSIFLIKKNKYFRFYASKKLVDKKDAEEEGTKQKIPYWYIFKKGICMHLNVFTVLFISIGTFPCIESFIEKSSENFFIPDKYYTNILCFFTYNLFTVIGSVVAPYIHWPKPKYIWIPVVIRILLLPIFLFCNYQVPGVVRRLPVWFGNDYAFWFLSALNGLSSGYLLCLTMMYVPGCVEPEYASVASMFASAMLYSGVFIAICFSFLYPTFIKIGPEPAAEITYSLEYGEREQDYYYNSFFCHFFECYK